MGSEPHTWFVAITAESFIGTADFPLSEFLWKKFSNIIVQFLSQFNVVENDPLVIANVRVNFGSARGIYRSQTWVKRFDFLDQARALVRS